MDGHRSFVDDATELTLGLPGTVPRGSNKRALPEEDKGESRMNEAKVQVVGWPPVRSYRRSNMQKRKAAEAVDESSSGGMYVKVGMDGAPYLRKIDLEVYKSYKELRENLVGMFKGFSLGEYVITYEDKDGDWMMVGDVPWEMFISTCRRLRIMKGSEARGVGSNP